MDRAMSGLKILAGLGCLAALTSQSASAAELRSETLQAWSNYVKNADARMQDRSEGASFLLVEESPDRMARLRAGEVIVSPAIKKGTVSVPDGLIHHWIGAAFIPNTTLARLLAVVHDYNRYKEFYQPVVTDSKVLACTDSDQRFSMTWQHKVLFVRAAIEGEYSARDTFVSAHRAYNIASTTEMREIEDYGEATERLLPAGQGNGYIWRLHSIAAYEERDGGVYVELQALALTRGVPTSLRWLVNPVINRLSMNSVATTLQQTRDAVRNSSGDPRTTTACGRPGRHVMTATTHRGE